MRDLSNENVIHIKKGEIQYLQFRKLLKYDNIITHAYSLGVGLNFRTSKVNKEKLLSFEYKRAIESYKSICNSLEMDYRNVVKTNQEHTDNLEYVDKKINKYKMDVNLEKYKNTDGLMTNTRDIILSTTNADCILMMFFDPITNSIANIHSGWRGTLQRISVKTVEKMKQKFSCKTENIICCICPSIRQCHFEVDIDVKNLFEEQFQDLGKENLEKIIKKQKDKEKWNIDTVLINKILLEKQGLIHGNIIDSKICSVCNSDLIHSYRVEQEGYGLSTALISLK